MKIGGLDLKWLGHSGFLIDSGKKIYIDPYKIPNNSEGADLILITHGHYDHCSFEDIKKIVRDGTKIVMPAECQSKVARFDSRLNIEILEQGQSLDLGPIKIISFPAYNVDKNFHPKDAGGLGYLVKTDKALIYHAGDTDFIEEMQKLTGHKQEGKEFIVLLPVGGRFTMSSEEASEAAESIKPDLAIPIHWGSLVGSKEDAEDFRSLCEEKGINVKIPEKD